MAQYQQIGEENGRLMSSHDQWLELRKIRVQPWLKEPNRATSDHAARKKKSLTPRTRCDQTKVARAIDCPCNKAQARGICSLVMA